MFGKAILAGLQGPTEKGVKTHQHQKKASRYREIKPQQIEIKKIKIQMSFCNIAHQGLDSTSQNYVVIIEDTSVVQKTTN